MGGAYPPSPGRLSPAGPGPSSEPERYPVSPASYGPDDMERTLGALRDFTRRDILLRFYADHKPRSVDEVAKAVGVHRTVAFDHLERLVALGYLEVERRRGLPGKPAKIYRLTAGPVMISHPMRRYDVLAEGLARWLVESFSGSGRDPISLAGRAFGRSLARPAPTSVPAALEPLGEMGGDYEVYGSHIECRNCLFAEVCHRVPEVCDFHAGVIEGLMHRDSQRSGIRPLGRRGPGGCAYEMSE